MALHKDLLLLAFVGSAPRTSLPSAKLAHRSEQTAVSLLMQRTLGSGRPKELSHLVESS